MLPVDPQCERATINTAPIVMAQAKTMRPRGKNLMFVNAAGLAGDSKRIRARFGRNLKQAAVGSTLDHRVRVCLSTWSWTVLLSLWLAPLVGWRAFGSKAQGARSSFCRCYNTCGKTSHTPSSALSSLTEEGSFSCALCRLLAFAIDLYSLLLHATFTSPFSTPLRDSPWSEQHKFGCRLSLPTF